MAKHLRTHKHAHQKKPKTFLDYIVYFFAIATPAAEIPQLIAIYTSKDAGSVSLFTWGFFLAAALVFATYTFREKIWPLFITNCLYIVIETAIVFGIVIYS